MDKLETGNWKVEGKKTQGKEKKKRVEKTKPNEDGGPTPTETWPRIPPPVPFSPRVAKKRREGEKGTYNDE